MPSYNRKLLSRESATGPFWQIHRKHAISCVNSCSHSYIFFAVSYSYAPPARAVPSLKASAPGPGLLLAWYSHVRYVGNVSGGQTGRWGHKSGHHLGRRMAWASLSANSENRAEAALECRGLATFEEESKKVMSRRDRCWLLRRRPRSEGSAFIHNHPSRELARKVLHMIIAV
ncbi:hypothetical protein BC827DRAFT_29327 [Russula dissimulans]|nr:hypothetical protein BC827DRAFT_29327 [Russula dissimulans]